jgi:hypothetical protein
MAVKGFKFAKKREKEAFPISRTIEVLIIYGNLAGYALPNLSVLP